MRYLGLAALTVAALGALPAFGQAPPVLVDAGCTMTASEPCAARINFKRQRSFTITINASGSAQFVNQGNRRCQLEYSLTNANSAAAGRSLNLGPSAATEVVIGTGPVSMQFTYRGLGSEDCDLAVSVK